MDTLLYWNFHALLNTEEDAIQVGEICNQLKCAKIDEFTRMYVVLLFHFPIQGGLRKAFDNADTLAQQIGIASRHLIKVAKMMDVPQIMIDRFVQVKNSRDYWVESDTETMIEQHDKVEDLKRNPSENAMEELYYAGVTHTRSKTRRDNYKMFLNKLTHDLIKEVTLRKRNSAD